MPPSPRISLKHFGGAGPYLSSGDLTSATVLTLLPCGRCFIIKGMDGSIVKFVQYVSEGGVSAILDAWPSPFHPTAWAIITAFGAFEALLMVRLAFASKHGMKTDELSIRSAVCNVRFHAFSAAINLSETESVTKQCLFFLGRFSSSSSHDRA